MPMRIFSVAIILSFAVSSAAVAAAPETIVVTASRLEKPVRETGSSVSVIDAAVWRARGAIFVSEALQSLAGVNVTQSGGAGGQSVVRLRGEEGYRTLVLIDGIRVADPAAPQVLTELAHLSLGGVARIEVVRGPQSLLYGSDAIGGVINILSRRGAADDFAELVVGGGSFGTLSAVASVGGKRGMFDATATIAGFATDGFSSQEFPGFSEKDGYDNATLHTVLGFEPQQGTRIEAVLRVSDAVAAFDRFGDNDNILYTEQTAARLSARFPMFAGAVRSVAALNYTSQNRADYASGAPFVFGSRFDGERLRAEYQAEIALGGGTLLAGADYESETATTDAIDATRDILGVFGEWSGALSDNAFASFGVRYDDADDSGTHLSLRATGAFHVLLLAGEEKAKLHASIGTGFRSPSLFERLDAFSGNPGLVEEAGLGFDFGIEQRLFDGAATVSLTWFDQRIDDEIRFDPIGFTYIQSNGTSTSRGLEAELSALLGKATHLDIAYTYTDATVSSTDAEDGLPRARRPRHVASLRLAHDFLDGSAHVGLSLRAVADHEDGFFIFRTKLDDFVTIGIDASYDIAPGVALFVRAINVSDEQYQEVAGFAAADASVYGGFRITR